MLIRSLDLVDLTGRITGLVCPSVRPSVPYRLHIIALFNQLPYHWWTVLIRADLIRRSAACGVKLGASLSNTDMINLVMHIYAAPGVIDIGLRGTTVLFQMTLSNEESGVLLFL